MLKRGVSESIIRRRRCQQQPQNSDCTQLCQPQQSCKALYNYLDMSDSKNTSPPTSSREHKSSGKADKAKSPRDGKSSSKSSKKSSKRGDKEHTVPTREAKKDEGEAQAVQRSKSTMPKSQRTPAFPLSPPVIYSTFRSPKLNYDNYVVFAW